MTLEPGDLLLLYSDGVTEAKDVAEEDFGDDALIDHLRGARSRCGNAEEVVTGVFEAVDAFAKDAPQYDDITAMAIWRRG